MALGIDRGGVYTLPDRSRRQGRYSRRFWSQALVPGGACDDRDVSPEDGQPEIVLACRLPPPYSPRMRWRRRPLVGRGAPAFSQRSRAGAMSMSNGPWGERAKRFRCRSFAGPPRPDSSSRADRRASFLAKVRNPIKGPRPVGTKAQRPGHDFAQTLSVSIEEGKAGRPSKSTYHFETCAPQRSACRPDRGGGRRPRDARQRG